MHIKQGTDVTFHAIIRLGHQYRIVPLTPTLSCLPSANDGDDRKALHKAFTAASVLLACIIADGPKLDAAPGPKILFEHRFFPAVTRLKRRGKEGYIDFQIQKFHDDRQSYRLLYIAKTQGTEEKEIIVKFTRQYSIELHEYCSTKLRCAPDVLAFDRLPGGWNAVAMEYISSALPILESGRLANYGEKWKQDLTGFVDAFHTVGFVHGDLREANIICDDQDRLMLIDFDWGGLDGKVSYPSKYLNSHLTDKRTATDLTITKEDDKRILSITLEKISNRLRLAQVDS